MQGCPDLEGLTWYIGGGSPKLDDKTLWVFANHLYAGGIWLKKKSEISHFSSTEAIQVPLRGFQVKILNLLYQTLANQKHQ